MGEPDVDRMLRRMSARQFARMVWAEDVEPTGELRDDFRTAMIVSMVHNVAVEQKYHRSIDDCLLRFSPPKGQRREAKQKKQTVAEQVNILNILAAAFSVPGKDE